MGYMWFPYGYPGERPYHSNEHHQPKRAESRLRRMGRYFAERWQPAKHKGLDFLVPGMDYGAPSQVAHERGVHGERLMKPDLLPRQLGERLLISARHRVSPDEIKHFFIPYDDSVVTAENMRSSRKLHPNVYVLIETLKQDNHPSREQIRRHRSDVKNSSFGKLGYVDFETQFKDGIEIGAQLPDGMFVVESVTALNFCDPESEEGRRLRAEFLELPEEQDAVPRSYAELLDFFERKIVDDKLRQ